MYSGFVMFKFSVELFLFVNQKRQKKLPFHIAKCVCFIDKYIYKALMNQWISFSYLKCKNISIIKV